MAKSVGYTLLTPPEIAAGLVLYCDYKALYMYIVLRCDISIVKHVNTQTRCYFFHTYKDTIL